MGLFLCVHVFFFFPRRTNDDHVVIRKPPLRKKNRLVERGGGEGRVGGGWLFSAVAVNSGNLWRFLSELGLESEELVQKGCPADHKAARVGVVAVRSLDVSCPPSAVPSSRLLLSSRSHPLTG